MIYDMLFPWQKKIVDKIKDKETYGIWVDMGCGKTPMSMALAEINKCEKVIVVSINSKAEEKIEEKGSWLWWASKSNIPYKLYTKKDFKKAKEFTNGPEVILINYEGLYDRNSEENVGRKKKDRVVKLKDQIVKFVENCKDKNVAIILDECHKIKDTSSLQTKAIVKLKSLVKMIAIGYHLYLATGTPFTQGFIDLYSQLKLLNCPLTKTQFEDNYCIKGNVYGLLGWQQPIIGYKNVEELYDLVHQYAITLKSEEVIDLPDKIFVNHNIPMSDEFRLLTTEKASKRMNEVLIQPRIAEMVDIPKEFKQSGAIENPFYRNMDFPNLNWFADTSANFWLRARQISIGFQGNKEDYMWYNNSRIEALKSFLEGNEENYVVFYNYMPELFKLFDLFDELGYNIDVYCGELKTLRNYEKFESQTAEERLVNKKNVILSNFISGSTGKNWQLYNHCIIFSLPLYKDFEQGIKRIHRIGSKEPTIYHLFYQDNWLDNGMLKALEEKRDYSKELFENDLKLNKE